MAALLRIFLFLTPWLFAGAASAADGISPADYLVRNWTTADGVPHNTVRTLVPGRDGYLWLGTANGLARFDGVRFLVFNLANSPGLLSDDIYSLYEDRQKNLWMRTRRGLARRRVDGQFEMLSSTNRAIPARYWDFAEDNKDRLWMRGPDGFARWTGEKIEPVPLPDSGPISPTNLCAAPNGDLWLADQRGLWRFRDGQFELVPVSPAPERIAAGPDGKVWGLNFRQGLFVLTNGVWSRVAEFGNEFCTTLYLAPGGDVWVGSDRRNHVFRIRDGRVTELSWEQGLEGNRVLAFTQDVDGIVWLGANAGGLFRLRERRVRVYDRRDGLEGLNTASLVETEDGGLMVNVMGSTLHRFSNQRFQPLRIISPQSYDNPTALSPAKAGGVWGGTFFGSLRRVVDSREVERVGSDSGTRALFTDREGRLWRGTRTAGIERFAGTNLTRFSTNEGLSFANVYCFAQDRDGAVWAGTEQGLNRISQDKITRFSVADGLGHPFVSALCVDSRGTVWAGTLGGGLSAWNGKRFVTMTTREGLSHDAVEQLLEDDLGYLWIGTRLGLMRASVDQLHDCIDGKSPAITGMLIGRDEGLVRPNFWTEYQPATLKTRDGRLWFCTGSGVVEIDPRRFGKPAAPPIVHLEKLSVDGNVLFENNQPSAQIKIEPGAERIEIGYTGISSSEPTQVRFLYRLVGYDRDWVDARRARVAAYSKLPPGPYTFQVKAVNNDGIWDETDASLALFVAPAIWQTIWFRLALAACGVALLFAAHRWRVAQLERRRAAQEVFSRRLIDSQEQERKRIAAELHDSLGQNLLVIKNRASLALAQQTSPDKMISQVQEMSVMASAAVREVRAIAQNLRPFQLDELGLTKSIRSMARTVGDASGLVIETDLEDVDGSLPPEFEINLYRAVQECLNNVSKHSQAKTASVTSRRGADAICIIVNDDGCGFVMDRSGREVAQGFGLRNITERMRTMAGHAQIHSEPGAGTRIELRVPFSVDPKGRPPQNGK